MCAVDPLCGNLGLQCAGAACCPLHNAPVVLSLLSTADRRRRRLFSICVPFTLVEYGSRSKEPPAIYLHKR